MQLQDALGHVWTYGYTVDGAITTLAGPDDVVRTWNYNHPNRLLASETHPESGTVAYTYQQGVLSQRVDAKGTTFLYGYDLNDRVKQVTAGSQVTQITYETGSDNVASIAVTGRAATTPQVSVPGRLHVD